jgi:hypothetical protein
MTERCITIEHLGRDIAIPLRVLGSVEAVPPSVLGLTESKATVYARLSGSVFEVEALFPSANHSLPLFRGSRVLIPRQHTGKAYLAQLVLGITDLEWDLPTKLLIHKKTSVIYKPLWSAPPRMESPLGETRIQVEESEGERA